MVVNSKSLIVQAFTANFNECADNTTFHGIKPLIEKKRTLCERGWWMIGLGICVALFVYFVIGAVDEFRERTVLETIESDPIYTSTIPFPAFTICPGILLDKNNYAKVELFKSLKQFYSTSVDDRGLPDNFTSGEKRFIEILEPLMLLKSGNDKRYYQKLYETYYNSSDGMSPEFIKELRRVSHLGNNYMVVDEGYYFEPIPVLTEYGWCLSYNILPGIFKDTAVQHDYKYIDVDDKIHFRKNESKSAYSWTPELEVVEDWNKLPYPRKHTAGKSTPFSYRIYDYIPKRTLAIPFEYNGQYRIAIHAPTEYPVFNDYEIHSYSESVAYEIDVKLITTKESIRSWSPEKRGCYFENENPLKYFHIYSEHNCRLECVANLFVKKCNCTMFALPRDQDHRICSARDLHCVKDIRSVDAPELFSMAFDEEFVQFSQQNYDTLSGSDVKNCKRDNQSYEDCKCYPSCVRYEYTAKLTKPTSTVSSVTFENYIYFKNMKIYKQVRGSSYSFVKFFSEFGGLIGLFLGGSVLSLFEIGLLCSCCKSKKKHPIEDDETAGNTNGGFEGTTKL